MFPHYQHALQIGNLLFAESKDKYLRDIQVWHYPQDLCAESQDLQIYFEGYPLFQFSD
jgi:hypothetical protein